MKEQQYRKKHPHFFPMQHRVAGQSIPLIAIMLVVLIAFVALAVDVGNTYANQRRVTRAANAGATVAMQTYIEGGDDAMIARDLEAAFRDNGIEPVPPTRYDEELGYRERRVAAYYLDAEGNRIVACPVGTCGETPGEVAYIEVEVDGLVDTTFAQVIGHDQLVVNSEAFSSMCPPMDGVYPLAVHTAMLGDVEAIPPQFGGTPTNLPATVYMPDIRARYSQQRLYLDGPHVSAAFLRWKESDDLSDLPFLFEGVGALRYGFEELEDWPEPSTQPEPDPETGEINYPLSPGYLNQGDWVRGAEHAQEDGKVSFASGTAMEQQLRYFKESRTALMLPIYRTAVPYTEPGYPNSNTYHVTRFGKFYVIDYGIDADHSNARYVDLAFESIDPVVPCDAENVLLPPDRKFGLDANVYISPYIEDQPESYKPAAYTVMLDVSGSMNWDFRGFGYYEPFGETFQCESFNPNIPYRYVEYVFGSSCTSTSPPAHWNELPSRRIYVAREALVQIAENMNDDERMRIIAFSSGIRDVSDEWFSNEDIDVLRSHIRVVGQPGGPNRPPNYRGGGGTAGPDALIKARALITNDSSDSDAFNASFPVEGPDSPRAGSELRRVLVYITDGVANRMPGNEGSPSGPWCNGVDNKVNITACQIGVLEDGTRLPITEMQYQSQMMQIEMDNMGQHDFVLYVLAMGRLDISGLDRVASGGSDTLFAASSPSETYALLQRIRNEVSEGVCVVERKPETNRIAPAEIAENREYWVSSDLTAEDIAAHGDDIHGYAHIRSSTNGTDIKLPVHHDSETGELVLALEPENGLVPGMYTLEIYIYYNAGGVENGTRLYDRIYDESSGQKVSTISFEVTPVLGDRVRIQDLHLDLRDSYISAMCQ